jgi:hypothetical protein
LSSSPKFGPKSRKIQTLEMLGETRASLWARRCASMLFLAVFTSTLFWLSANATPADSLETLNPPVSPVWPLPAAFEGYSDRKIFPYSIIPGGVESPQELRNAVMSDPVVAQHYSDFDLSRARRVNLNAPQLMYVSYRVGNNVFWTKRKLALAKGESMMTDGRSMVRGRCGNRISAIPIRPNSLAEPTVEEFNAPVLPPTVSTPYLAANSAAMPAIPSAPASHLGSGPSSSFTPVAPFFPLPGGGSLHPTGSTPGGGGNPPPGGGGGSTPPPGGGGTPPPVGIPEPSTGGLVIVAFAVVCMLLLTRKAW